MDENKTPGQTPEQLLQMLELQIQMQRNKRQLTAQGLQGKRAAILISAFVLLVGGLLAAFLFLQDRVSSSPRSARSLPPSTVPSREH